MIDEKKLPFYVLMSLEKFLSAKNQGLCYANSFCNDFCETLETALKNEDISQEAYDYLNDTYFQ